MDCCLVQTAATPKNANSRLHRHRLLPQPAFSRQNSAASTKTREGNSSIISEASHCDIDAAKKAATTIPANTLDPWVKRTRRYSRRQANATDTAIATRAAT